MGSIADVRARLAAARQEGAAAVPRVALVPTMGALHDGHLALVERAREIADIVVVSIFVNPLQFGAGEDLDRYPRTLDADLTRLAEAGVPFVFAPTAREMYPEGSPGTRVTAGAVGSLYEGAARPGHFDGMLTVVAKLFNIVGPDVAVFGQKDAQQVFLVQRMVADLDLPLRIDVAPIVREESGLALSSRNRYLDEAQRAAAHALSAALAAAASVARGGDATAGQALAAARDAIEAAPMVKLDYLVVVHPHTFLPVGDDYRGPARMLVAALVGTTRLIDNTALDLDTGRTSTR
ncbi:pantoate--beta-alanine ligase [Cryobacterium tepidiphilum]|uniref:Pantothenate synthetase n=1 Tax=Cryobacterium tepidiphilum TaxID=2486026 RepID=A0A3M8LRT8_9MICO|nr:pantoate--beta-alanine ligase [Cryobacterium tepidiphilum]